jgi:hypothetical protein
MPMLIAECFDVTNVLFSVFAVRCIMVVLDIKKLLAGGCGGTVTSQIKLRPI